METRDILDWQGNVIGQMELPSGTSESDWTAKLASFAKNPNDEPIRPITQRQIRLCLLSIGITDQNVLDALDQLPEPDKSLSIIEWNYSIEFDRYHPLVGEVGALFGMNSSQLDDLWRSAAAIQ